MKFNQNNYPLEFSTTQLNETSAQLRSPGVHYFFDLITSHCLNRKLLRLGRHPSGQDGVR